MEDYQAICGDGAKLLAFTAGTLGRDDSSAVRAHLASCSRCREVVRENDEIGRFYRSALGEESLHPSAVELTAFAEGELEPSLRATIQSHLDRCGECGQIVLVLEKVQMDVDSPGLAHKVREFLASLASDWRRLWRGLPLWVRGPVPAYLLVLLLMYPAYIGFSGRSNLEDRMGELSTPKLLPPPTTLDSEIERGPNERPVRIDHRDGRTVLTFFVPIAPDLYRYQIVLRRGASTILSVPDAQSFDSIGTFVLFAPEGSLEPGDYQLRVEEIDRQSGATVSVASFPFAIER